MSAQEQQAGEYRVKHVIPVNAENFIQWMKQVRSKVVLDEELRNICKEDVNAAIKMAIAAIQPWVTDAGLVVMATDPEAFKYDVKRKIVGVAETIKNIVVSHISECAEALDAMHGYARRGGAVEEDSAMEEDMARSDEAIMKSMEKCINALRKGYQGILAFLMALDIILGAVQSNLPASLMSNVIKGRTGFFTD